MKYDLTQCNNLRWKSENDAGFIKTDGNKVCLLSDKMWLDDYGNLVHCNTIASRIEIAEMYLIRLPNFEIVPRAPETYKDWQTGDVVRNGKSNIRYIIAERNGRVVYLSRNGEETFVGCYFCEQLFNMGFRLVLPDYEKSLIEKDKDECPFKAGDRVLVRDNHISDVWQYARFMSYNGDAAFPYKTLSDSWKQCVPYNEKTWRLLGTSDTYEVV